MPGMTCCSEESSPFHPFAETPRARDGAMGSVLSSKPQSPEERAALQKEINKVIAQNPVVIFSKTWCRRLHVHTVDT